MSVLLLRLYWPDAVVGHPESVSQIVTQEWNHPRAVSWVSCAPRFSVALSTRERSGRIAYGCPRRLAGGPSHGSQTAMNVREASAKTIDIEKGKGVHGSISKRFYLSDACFLVGLESDDQSLLTELHRRLCDPVWPLYLGRKAFVPGEPVWLGNGWRPDEILMDVIRRYDWLVRREIKNPPKELRVVVDSVVSTDEVVVAEQVRPDYPLSLAERRFSRVR